MIKVNGIITLNIQLKVPLATLCRQLVHCKLCGSKQEGIRRSNVAESNVILGLQLTILYFERTAVFVDVLRVP